MSKVRVGVINSGWWADAMYLPALTAHPDVEVTGVCGRNQEKVQKFAKKWGIGRAYTDYREMLTNGSCDAVVVAAINSEHHPMTMLALENNLHVLCEKPLAKDVQEAAEMTALAEAKQAKTLVPFTYRFMPHNRYIKQLIDDGFIGDPYHLNIRYYHAFGRNNDYGWMWDTELTGGGALASLAVHPIYIAYWYFGRIESVTAELNQSVERTTLRPDGSKYTPNDDNGILALRFENGATGVVHFSAVSYETSPFEQQHFYDIQGSNGSLYHTNNWVDVQETIGGKVGEPLRALTLPNDIWGHANIPGNVHESYKAVFRKDRLMVGEWIDAIINNTTTSPDFADGLHIQKAVDAAILSSQQGKRVVIS